MGKETNELKGKARRVLVTGASTGIGADCVRALAAAGWEVWAAFRDPAQAASATATMSNGGSVRGLVLDLEDAGSAERMASEFSRQAAGGLDALVHAAGYVEPGLLEWIGPEDLRRQLDVNVVGAHAVTRSLLPALRSRSLPTGRVVWISSVSGRVALPGIGAYAASKFALEALADAWRIELGDEGISFTLVEPGPIETPIWGKAEQALDRWKDVADPGVLAVFREQVRASQAEALPVGVVSDAVLRSLEAASPPARVLLSREAWALRILRVLPDRWRDALVRGKYRAALKFPGKR